MNISSTLHDQEIGIFLVPKNNLFAYDLLSFKKV